MAVARMFCLNLLLVLCSLGLTRAYPKGSPSFFDNFIGAESLDYSRWWTSGPWANGQPFNNGWDRSFFFFKADDGLSLKLEKKRFEDPGSSSGGYQSYDFTSGELRSADFYGYGCYSTCMLAARVSGVTSSFYIYNGPYDTPSDAGRYYNDHNEIDVEFVGYDTTVFQTNYFSRGVTAGSNSGSGNEKLHDLGFDASKTWAAYSFRWSKGKIEWYVNGKKLREEGWKPEKPVPLQSYSTARIVANIWPVNEQAEEWAGDLDHSISTVTAHYKWIRYDEGESCDIPTSC